MNKNETTQESAEVQDLQIISDITHADFLAGVRDGTISFDFVPGQPLNLLIRGARRMVLVSLNLLHMVSLILLIPLWAWHEQNWWLLLGMVAWIIGTQTAALLTSIKKSATSLGGFLAFVCLMCWIFLGFHNYYTFFILSTLCGLIFFATAEHVEIEYALQSVVENPHVFREAILRNLIVIARR